MTDAEFAAWLLADKERVWLVEIDYVWAEYVPDVWDTYIATIYLSTVPYIDGEFPYIDRLRAVPLPSSQIDRATLGGQVTRSFGSLTFDNADGYLDFMLSLAIDGSEVRIYLGDASWEKADFRLMATALSRKANATDDSLEIPLTDKSSKLNATILAEVFAGDTTNEERVQPLVFGVCHNVTLAVEDIADVRYRAGQTGTQVIYGTVRENGLPVTDGLEYTLTSGASFNTGTDFLLYDGHQFINEDIVAIVSDGTYPSATPGLSGAAFFVRNKNSGGFQLSATRTGAVVDFTTNTWTGTLRVVRVNYRMEIDGSVTLAHPAAGTITADLTGPTAADSPASDIIEDIVDDYSTLEASEIEGAHASYPVGDATDFPLGVLIDRKANLADAISQICDSAQAFWCFNHEGKFTYGRICSAALAADSEMDFTIDDVIGPVRVTHADPLYWLINGYYNKNWTVQDASSFWAAVTPENVAIYSSVGLFFSGQIRPPRVGTTTPIQYNQYHKSTTESDQRETLVSCIDPDDASDAIDDWTNLYLDRMEPYGEFVDIMVGRRAYGLNLGAVVTYTQDRYGFDAGPKFQVVGYAPTDDGVALTLFRNRIADLTTGTHRA